VPLLAEIPLHLDIRLASDGGAPIVVSKPESAQAQAFRHIARDLIEKGLA
jgi:ATP-binding protein involved in chromosome partitioning